MQVNRERLKCISGIPEVLYASKERRARPKDQQDAWRVVPLVLQRSDEGGAGGFGPAARDIRHTRCERVTAGVGKCSVCGLEKAVWIDSWAGHRSDRALELGDRDRSLEDADAGLLLCQFFLFCCPTIGMAHVGQARSVKHKT
jgi:hypothetical protein